MIAHPTPKSKPYLLWQEVNSYPVGNVYMIAPALEPVALLLCVHQRLFAAFY